jgi:tetraacyldisaccharide 4'-kinase
VTVVSRGNGPEVGPTEVGDEPVMLAKSFPGFVITAARRIEGAEAAAELGCEAIVLDDGFQHRAIARVFDVVLLDARRRGLLPAGPLRERLGALRRAQAVVVVGGDEDGGRADVPRGLGATPVYRMRIEPTRLVESIGGKWHERPLGLLGGHRVVAVAGVARPERFYDFLREWEAVIDDVFEYPDHHHYTRADWQHLVRNSQHSDLIVTTEKDLAKLEAYPFATGKLVALRIEAQVEGGEELVDRVVAALGTGPRVSEPICALPGGS